MHIVFVFLRQANEGALLQINNHRLYFVEVQLRQKYHTHQD